VADSYKEAVRQVIEAGLNVRTNFTQPKIFIEPLRELVKEGSLSMKTLDSRVADVLRVKFRLGLFDHPYVKDPKKADEVLKAGVNAAFMMQMARESLVLLKNDSALLPLDKSKIRRILVTGPLAMDTGYAISRYGPSNVAVTTVLEGIRSYLGKGSNIVVDYSKGCNIIDATWPESEIIPTPLTPAEQGGIAEAVTKASQSDIIIDYATARRREEPISTAVTESTVQWLLHRRMNAQQQMRWTPRGAHLMLKVRCAVMNGTLDRDHAVAGSRACPPFRRAA